MSTWLKSLLPSKKRDSFTDVEEHVLNAVRERLSPTARELLDRQIGAVNLIQRHAGGKEVNLYAMSGGQVRWPSTAQFPNRQQELHLTSVRLAGDDGKPVTIDVHLVDGFLFSVEFDRAPEEVSDPVRVESVKMHNDPMVPSAVAERQRATVRWAGWLRDLEHRGIDIIGFSPLKENELKEVLAQLNRPMPPDYTELLSQSDGVEIGKIVIFDGRSIRSVALDDATYYMIGEIDGEAALAVRKEPTDGHVYVIAYDQSGVIQHPNLRTAIDAALGAVAPD